MFNHLHFRRLTDICANPISPFLPRFSIFGQVALVIEYLPILANFSANSSKARLQSLLNLSFVILASN